MIVEKKLKLMKQNGIKKGYKMWKIIKVCPMCLCSEFNKDEDNQFVCNDCEEIYEYMDDLQNMDIEE